MGEDPMLAGFAGFDGCPALPCDGEIAGECAASGWCAAMVLRQAFQVFRGDEDALTRAALEAMIAGPEQQERNRG